MSRRGHGGSPGYALLPPDVISMVAAMVPRPKPAPFSHVPNASSNHSSTVCAQS